MSILEYALKHAFAKRLAVTTKKFKGALAHCAGIHNRFACYQRINSPAHQIKGVAAREAFAALADSGLGRQRPDAIGFAAAVTNDGQSCFACRARGGVCVRRG